MKKQIQNLSDIAQLRYDIVRFYDLPELNGTLKAFVMAQLDDMIEKRTPADDFIQSQQAIYDGTVLND